MTKIFVDNDEDLRHTCCMSKKHKKPTELETEILAVLWEQGPSTVREITNIFNESRPTGYTTILKMLQIMNDKGLVRRDESIRPQVYQARYSREETQQQLLRDLMQRAFDGSMKSLVMQALSTKQSSPEDLAAIEALLDRIEGESK